ncbi:MAG: hypothetical protein A2284_13230 [Deltaproteobacteria bacterium RIFOXYA12_FULL_61_11]|nr:MAG: hypothetical protein A2284_13230 [Deltaproteobacteria bacterium RIFOXYA12_FULL_61_11]
MGRQGSFTLTAGKVALVPLQRGKTLLLRDREGGAVVHLVMVVKHDVREYFDRGWTLHELRSLRPTVGDVLYSNRGKPLAIIAEDNVRRHDLLLPSLPLYPDGPDPQTLLRGLFRGKAVPREALLQSLNLFLNVEIGFDGALTILPAAAGPGGYILFEAREELLLALCVVGQDLSVRTLAVEVLYTFAS